MEDERNITENIKGDVTIVEHFSKKTWYNIAEENIKK